MVVSVSLKKLRDNYPHTTNHTPLKNPRRIKMPKVYFDRDVRAKSGRYKGSNVVYKAAKNKTIGLSRSHAKNTRISDHMKLKGRKMKAASAMWHVLSDSFKADLERYTILYNQQHLPEEKLKLNAFCVYTSALLKYSIPIDDISTLVSIFGNSLNSWIEKGFLKRVQNPIPFNAVVIA